MLSTEDYQRIFHEIKNELTVIGCSLQLIEKQNPDVRSLPYWNDTMTDFARLRDMILSVSSIRSSETAELCEVDLKIVLNDFKHTAQKLVDNEKDLIFEIPSVLPMCYLDPLRLHRALLNLVKNAIEASDPGVPVTFRVETTSEEIIFQIIDHGKGIDPDHIACLYAPFFSQKTNGSGLGLPIVKNIIDSHKGTIDCESSLGVGTTFTVKIPLIISQNGISDPRYAKS